MSMDFFRQFDQQITSGNNDRKMIVFSINSINCALDIMIIKEILNPLEVTPLPGTSSYIVGIADHRQSAITVIDIRPLFKTASKINNHKKWIIALLEHDKMVALEVDIVKGVEDIKLTDQRELDAIKHPWSKAVYGTDNGLIFELDLSIITDEINNITTTSGE